MCRELWTGKLQLNQTANIFNKNSVLSINIKVNSLIDLIISQISLFLLNRELCVKTSIPLKKCKKLENKQLIPSIPLIDLVFWSV